MSSNSGSVISLQIGPVAPLGAEGVPSGFIKRPTDAPVMAERLGLVGDKQADLRVHGGPDKAIYWYPVQHYARWREIVPQHSAQLRPGGFGENLTISTFDEDRVAIGDIFRIGSATVQVTQPRQPCFKLALRFDDPRMVRAMVRTGLSGWYLRVLDPGSMQSGSTATLMERPNPTWSIARFNRLIIEGGATVENLTELADMPGLALYWQATARTSLGITTPVYLDEIFLPETPAPGPDSAHTRNVQSSLSHDPAIFGTNETCNV